MWSVKKIYSSVAWTKGKFGLLKKGENMKEFNWNCQKGDVTKISQNTEEKSGLLKRLAVNWHLILMIWKLNESKITLNWSYNSLIKERQF